jgi:hypothetical protein
MQTGVNHGQLDVFRTVFASRLNPENETDAAIANRGEFVTAQG